MIWIGGLPVQIHQFQNLIEQVIHEQVQALYVKVLQQTLQ